MFPLRVPEPPQPGSTFTATLSITSPASDSAHPSPAAEDLAALFDARLTWAG